MEYRLRDYQAIGVGHALRFLMAAGPGEKRLYASPTGTGKSLVLLDLQRRLAALPKSAWVVTPRVEIVRGFLEKTGRLPNGELSQEAMIRWGWLHRITTPVRLRNKMLKGEFAEPCDALLFDEGHHSLSSSYEQLDMLTGSVPSVGYTATPFRGTPRGTQALRALWGEPVWLVTMSEAIARGVLALPRCSVVPLVDDDLIEVANGEFAVRKVEETLRSRLDAAVELVDRWIVSKHASPDAPFDRPTMASLPTTEAVWDFASRLEVAGVPADTVTQETSATGRQAAFSRCLERRSILLQIAVVSEGVDLPIRRLLDLSPTLSPVRWLQQLGRITRPVGEGEPAPEYVCTNRNFERHCYLLEGTVPAECVISAQSAWDGVAGDVRNRTGLRVLGLEAVGKLRPSPLPLANGLRGSMYAFSAVEGGQVRQYAVLLHPCREETLWATRVNGAKDDGSRDYGRWARCEAPAELTGFASLPGSPLSEKQEAWWKRAAGRHGLDPNAPIDRKQFAALPVLSDLREKFA